MSKFIAFTALQAIAALASPIEFPELVPRQGMQSCRNQSCLIATVAGSTGVTTYPYSSYPVSDTQDGDCCIIRYFPAVKAAIYQERPNLQAYCQSTGGDAPLDSNPPGINSVTIPAGVHKRDDDLVEDWVLEKRAIEEQRGLEQRDSAATAPCKPNILIFAKGTFEPGDLGISIGNTLQQNLGGTGRWQVVGVNYDDGLTNNYCLGLPGGVTARATINQVFSTCPTSQIVVGGYSQGAMVMRNAIARIPAAQAAAIANVVTFGDPFCGAKIGQYSGPINVFCNDGDGVCDGQLNIGLAHLSYTAATSAATTMLQLMQK